MISRREQVSAMIEPGRTLSRVGGAGLQLVTVMVSDPDRDLDLDREQRAWIASEPPVAAAVTPEKARTLAFCLLELAEHAERVSRR